MPGVYISYPFCGQKCTYCNFASGVFSGELEHDYVEAVAAEIEGHAWEWRPETVYLGGGSPSRMGRDTLDRILAGVPGKPWREGTIEAAPGEVNAEKSRWWSDCGITRVSLGVQSFEGRELAQTGRRHTAETVAEDVATLREAGIGSVNIDLIAGLPGQTRESWERSLDWIGRLGVGHVSVYMLEVDQDSRLGREMIAGGGRYGAPEAPPEDEVAEMYERAVERLEEMGIHRYEISNFAREGEESLHNMKYWELEPYVGFGADAHSFDGRMRRQNVETAEDYVGRWRGGVSPGAEENEARIEEERFFVGLRMSRGIVPRAEEWERFRAPIGRFLREGLLERHGERLRLTGHGVLVSNEVFQEFLL